MWYVNGDRLVILHNFRSELSGIDVNEVQRILEDLHASSTLPLFKHFAVLSSTVDRYNLPVTNNEIMNAYRFFDDSSFENVTLRFDDLGIYKLLLAADDPSRLNGLIDPRLQRLHDDNPDLFRTAVTLCEHSLNFHETAEELFLHPKTVRYRIDRVREVYGVDVRNSDDFLQVILADKIIALSRKG